MSFRKFSPTDWNNRHSKQVEEYARRVQLIIYTAIREATQIATQAKPDPESEFSFEKYPKTKERVNDLFQRVALNLLFTIQAGQRAQWDFADQKNDAFVDSVFYDNKLPTEPGQNPQPSDEPVIPPVYKSRNEQALAAFQARTVGGLSLSDRVFKYAQQLRSELELAIDLGIGEGKSATRMSQDIRGYLNEPEQLFRRVRNKRGQLALSKAAKAYHPGRGVYRSSYKNAMRLARTEINMAYRESDHLRLQKLDFVVGIEVRRSNNTVGCDVCEALKGKYPKTFKFVGWHPNCKCHVISILATREELRELTRKTLAGEDTSNFVSDNQIEEPPAGWDIWLEDNMKRFEKPGASKPLFVVDNEPFVKAPLTPPIIRELTNIPGQLAGYEKKMRVKVDRRVFSMLNKSVMLSMETKEALFGYDPMRKYVKGYYASRYKQSKWKAETVIYHEYAHAIDWQQNLRFSPEVKQLMDKYRAEFSAANDALYKQLDRKLKDQSRLVFKKNKHDHQEKIAAARDTLMALNPTYGFGHDDAYWQIAGHPEAEFIAHAFENYFKGNAYFQSAMPGLYAESQALVANWLKALP
ncbi:hypothetical protein GCM10027592_29360 [Spirosoma flavus]